MATVDGHGGWILWPNYTPSFGAAVAFCTIFGVLSVAHGVLRTLKRTGFATPLIIGGILEAIAYGFRSYAHYHRQAELPQAVDALFRLVAPNFFAATIYLYAAGLIGASGAQHLSIIGPAWISRVFVGVDTISFIILFVGEGLYNGLRNLHGEKVGTDLKITGLLIQLFNICVFAGFAVTFHIRYARSALAKQYPAEAKKVKRLLLLTYKLCVSVWGRNIFILTITGMGPVGYLSQAEWWIYAFDGGQMIIVMLFGFIWYFYDVTGCDNSDIDLSGPPIAFKAPSDTAGLTTYWSDSNLRNPYMNGA